LIVEPDHAVLLCARKSYTSSLYYRDSSMLQRANFLEKISIPRGKWDSRDIFDYETAVREFIEETGTVFDTAHVYRAPFLLHWNDNGVTYRYTIYVGVVRGGALRNVSREPNTFCVKLHRDRANFYFVNLESRRCNREIPRHLYILPLHDYFQYMRERQLVTYESSNYLEFFDFVQEVKQEFDAGGDRDAFFQLTLKLDNLFSTLASRKWPPQRQVPSGWRQIKNIPNAA
jgi:8-oxo-dGTP pyrophosphatase MutT (NUDIX family)